MTPSELIFKFQNLPPNTPLTAEHLVAMLMALQAQQTVNNSPGAYSSWDNDKLITTETLSEWIGETESCLYKWRLQGTGPKFISKPRYVSYRVGDVRDWMKSRTAQSTTQADTLSFAAEATCYVRPTVLHDMVPVPLFESIETYDDETNFTGIQTLCAAEDSLAATYFMAADENQPEKLLSQLDLSDPDSLNQVTAFFINGTEEQCTLAHLLARFPFSNHEKQTELLIELLERGLDCEKPDGKMQSPLTFGNELFTKAVERQALHRKLEAALPKAPTKAPLIG